MVAFRYQTLCLVAAALVSRTAADEALLSSQTAFADALVPLLYDDPMRNDCTSALGVSMAFSLIYPSMIDPTLTETASVLGFPALSDTATSEDSLVWGPTEAALEAAHDGSCVFPEDRPPCAPNHPVLLISNSVWLDADRPLQTNYTDLLPATVLQNELAFADPTAGATVNAWVNQSTNGLIDSIVDMGPLSGVSLVAINAIYLKADWENPFREMYTTQDAFYTSPDTTVDDTFYLHTVAAIPYGQTSTHQVIALPLASKNGFPLTMTVALPFQTETTTDLATSDDILSLELNTSSFVALALPKFTFESEYSSSLQSALASLGLESPFQTGLCVYADDACTTSVDKIIQKTFIAVNEQGVEAAAVTALIGRNFPFFQDGATEFFADHPFQFFIHADDVVLFEGHVVAPQSDGAPISRSHADPDVFWSNTFGVSVVRATPSPATTTTGRIDNSTVVPVTMTTTQAPIGAVTQAPVVVPPVNIFAPTEAPVTMVGQAPNMTGIVVEPNATSTEPPVEEPTTTTEAPTQEPVATSDALDTDARIIEMPSGATASSRFLVWISPLLMFALDRWWQ